MAGGDGNKWINLRSVLEIELTELAGRCVGQAESSTSGFLYFICLDYG